MPYYQIISEDNIQNYLDELATTLPFEFFNIKVGDILPANDLFPERKILSIVWPL